MRSNYYILLWVGRVDKNWTWKETPQKGSDGPRCLATFANLGHLCTCRTSSLSPSQLRLMCSCRSWFAAKRSRVLYLGDIPRIPSHVSFRGKHEAEGANHWMSGLNMLQDHLSEIGHLGQGCAESWFGWIKWRLFCFGRVKICCCWSFIPSGNAILRGNSWRNNMLSWSFRELYLHLSQEPCGATKSGPAKSSQCKGLLRKPGTFARTIPYRLHVEWLDGHVIFMWFLVILSDSYVILTWFFNDI